MAPSFTPSRRNIPNAHDFDPRSLKPMARTLWAVGVAMGHALTAQRQFTRLKSSTISPDGLIGGRGYVMGVKEIRDKLHNACESLSAISDTLYDEFNAPHWKPHLSQLSKNDKEDVERFVDEAKKNMDDGEDLAEDEMTSIEEENDGYKGEGGEVPKSKKKEAKEEEKGWTPQKWKDEREGSKLPDGGSPDADHMPRGTKIGNSSLPVDTLPGGPRVDNLDRGLQLGPYGSFNEDEEPSQNDWNRPAGDEGYAYPSRFDNDLSARSASTGCLVRASSSTPGAFTDDTKTDAKNFGLGPERDGEGLNHTPAHPTGKGVWGPSSNLPHDPGGPTMDPDSTGGEDIDGRLDGLSVFLASWNKGRMAAFFDEGESTLPNDGQDPVARSDYYDGLKGNQFRQMSGLPGTQLQAKPTPTRPRPTSYDAMIATSEMPDAAPPMSARLDVGTPGPGSVTEDLTTPYVRWAPDRRELELDSRRNGFVRGNSNE